MPSPFPGMNPFLEQDSVWHDFHESFMPTVREVLAPQVRPQFVVKIDEHVYVHEIDVERVSFLEIRDRNSGRVVAVIELLSPTNKNPGPDRAQYLAKRAQLLNSSVHLVEIDLLRGGPRMPMTPLPECSYCVLVSRWQERPRAGLWSITLRERLPVIPVPLAESHPDAEVDLQQVLNRIYDAAGYEDHIYRGRPQPRLKTRDEKWARQFEASGR